MKITLVHLAPLFIGQKWHRGGTPDEVLTGVEYTPSNIILKYADGDVHTSLKDKITHKPILKKDNNNIAERGELLKVIKGNRLKNSTGIVGISNRDFALFCICKLTQGYDIFNLIDTGEAIDKTKHK